MPRLSKIGAAALGAFGWTGLSTVTASYLQVAGGGGASSYGGGGAGGYRTSTTSLNPTLSYTVTVGAGGAGGTDSPGTNGTNGSDSVFNAITSTGGGGGAYTPNVGSNGGSGGGGGGGTSPGNAGGTGNTPSTSPSQGNNGGKGLTDSTTYTAGGGGGGASAVGSNAAYQVGGAGGAGTASSISGSSVTYAGGGGGRSNVGTSGAGGAGGGGAGATSGVGTAGTANTGGGGGAGGTGEGAKGGSGVVIISYLGAQQFGGGVVTSSGGYTIHTFNTSGTLAPISSLSASYLIVAGGGGGAKRDAAMGGGGGAGGLLSGSGLTIDTNSTYLVTVGSGGAAAAADLAAGTNGGNSLFSAYATTALGGGGGGPSNSAGLSGGSGGGGSHASGGGGAGTSGQGNNGGAVAGNIGGGGGGAGAVGTTSGGNGSASSISGTSTTYAGGGGGGGNGVTGGSGGTGGGGAGANGSVGGVAGTANLGGGGGGGGFNTLNPAAGGSGVVIISYAGATQSMAGGTVTISGGNVIHTFTSSGYLTPLKLVNNSLRFRNSAGAYLNRTPTIASNRKTWTWSGWVKRGTLSTFNAFFGARSALNDNEYLWMGFNSSNQFQFALYTFSAIITTQVFQDPAAWYHIEVVLDTTESTASNRLKLYVNGTLVTAFGTDNRSSITQNQDCAVNNNCIHVIAGRYVNGPPEADFDGYMTEFNFIDGQALTPNSFGTFNSYGVWQPITYGGSYGTNGFYLPFNGRNSTYGGGFNGTNQYLSLSGFTPNWSTYTNFTVEMWIYVAAYPAVVAKVFGTEPAGSGGAYSIGYLDSTGTLAFGISTVNSFSSASAAIPTGKWTHLAFIRNGSNLNIYVNGTSVASTTSASTYCSNNTNTFLIGQAATYYLNGSISNFRFTNTAVYTGTFVPPTSPLTAISGTQLLTLQNATIIDNSTNAYTITNNNTVVMTAGTNIFANPVSLAADQSPAGNNWTANNISTTTGTTYDSMTDVPTLTSATVANYAVWNPLGGPSGGLQGTLSNGNLTWTSPATDQRCVLSTIPLNGDSTGKWYWEVTAISKTSTYWAIGAFPYNINQYSATSGSTQYRSDGAIFVNGSNVATVASYTAGDVIGITFDASNNQIKYYKNNSLQTTQTVANSAGYGIYAGAGSDSSGSTNVNAINFGQQPFVYTPPSGFLALNTYNI